MISGGQFIRFSRLQKDTKQVKNSELRFDRTQQSGLNATLAAAYIYKKAF